jgi:hypothetical protein
MSENYIDQTPKVRYLLMSVVIAVGLISCCVVLSRAFIRVRTADEMIRVIGSARKPIRSDLIIWTGSVTRAAPTVAQAYKQLQSDIQKITAYLVKNGISKSEISPMPIITKTLHAPPPKPEHGYVNDQEGASIYRKVVGFELLQGIEIRSSRVDLVDRISRQSTEMIGQGVSFQSNNPMYLYTKLSELKVTMQAEAAKDARARADQIARSSGCRIGKLRFARMNVPSITPLYSAQESDGGIDDSASIDKKITAIVVAGYSIR